MGLLSPHLLIKEGRSSCTAKEKDGVNELRLSSANTGRKAGWLLWQPATWLIYFRHCFLVAVTQRAGSSHVIIAGAGGGVDGKPWQLMQGLNHVHFAKDAEDSAGGGCGCQ